MCEGHNHSVKVSPDYYDGYEDCLSTVENKGTTAAENELNGMELEDSTSDDFAPVLVIFTVALFF